MLCAAKFSPSISRSHNLSTLVVLKVPNVLEINCRKESARKLSTARGLYVTKRVRREQPKKVILDDHAKRLLQCANNDEQKNEYSDKFMKGEV
jgi:hypothetical protein